MRWEVALLSKTKWRRLAAPAGGEKCNSNQAVGLLKLKTPVCTQRGVAHRTGGNCTPATRITIYKSSSNGEKLKAAPESIGFPLKLSRRRNFRMTQY